MVFYELPLAQGCRIRRSRWVRREAATSQPEKPAPPGLTGLQSAYLDLPSFAFPTWLSGVERKTCACFAGTSSDTRVRIPVIALNSTGNGYLLRRPSSLSATDAILFWFRRLVFGFSETDLLIRTFS